MTNRDLFEQWTTKQIKPYLREAYAWPGGYEFVFVMTDGELICGKCVRENWRLVAKDTWDGFGDWRIGGILSISNDWEPTEGEHCINCNRQFADKGE